MSSVRQYDVVIIGAGVIGLTIARRLAQDKNKSICILEKESELGKHASGKNSGVLHAGIYYSPDSLKAHSCVEGSRRMQAYAAEKGVPCKKTGKVIVAPSREFVPEIHRLYDKAVKNGVRVEKIDEQRLLEIEPYAKTCEIALYSPDTAVIDAKKILASLEADISKMGVRLEKSNEVKKVNVKDRILSTTQGTMSYKHLVNTAGLHADRIAHAMGIGERYCILPFKGIFRKLSAGIAERVNGSIYPAPDPAMPFLGVHVTKNIYGEVFAGPTAIPAFGRENYGAVDGLDLSATPEITFHLMMLWLKNGSNFRKLVKEEFDKYTFKGFLTHVRLLMPSIQPADLSGEGWVGLRAQLVDKIAKKLVMDFVVEDGPDSTHVLNAVSPAFTGSFAFADMIRERMVAKKAA